MVGYARWVEGGVENDESLRLIGCWWWRSGLGSEIVWVDSLEEAEGGVRGLKVFEGGGKVTGE